MSSSISSLTASCGFYFCKDLLIHLHNYSHFCADFPAFYPSSSTVLVVLLHFHTVLCRICPFSHRIIASLKQFTLVRGIFLLLLYFCVCSHIPNTSRFRMVPSVQPSLWKQISPAKINFSIKTSSIPFKLCKIRDL